MTRSRMVVRNVATTILTQLLSWGLTFLVTLYMPRYLGDVGMGEFTLANSVAAICCLIVSIGASTVLIREIARDHERAPELMTSALVLRLVLGFIALGVAELAALALHYEERERIFIGVAIGCMIIGQLQDVLCSALIGLEHVPSRNLASLVEKIVSTTLIVFFIWRHMPWWTLLAAGMASFAFSGVTAAISLRPYVRRLAEPRIRSMVWLIQAGYPFITTAIFVAIYGQADALVLSKVIHNPHLADETIGWYGLGRRLIGTVLFVPLAVTTALLPTLARVSKETPDAFLPMVRRLMNLMVIAVVPFAAVMMFAPRQILHLMHYPDSFLPSIPVMVVLGGGAIVWYLSQVAGTALIASDLQASLSRITGIAAAVSVPLCIALSSLTNTYLHNGATGAAISDVLVETYLLFAYLATLPRSPFGWANVFTLGRATAAALPLVVALVMTSHHILFIAALAGVMLYLPLCWLLRCIDPQDIAVMRTALSKRTAPEAVGGQYAAE